MMDVCVHISTDLEVYCLDALLYSMSVFADLESCNLLVSLNDKELYPKLQKMCSAHKTGSLCLDLFDSVGENCSGNNQHGSGLNRLIKQTTMDTVMLVDPDVLILSHGWRQFCENAVINDGIFVVGTPYHNAKAELLWQGTFPNCWCSVLNGQELRSCDIDMRPRFRKPPPGKAPDAWAPPRGFGGRKHDTSWELARYSALNPHRQHISLGFSEMQMASQFAGAEVSAMDGLNPLLYVLPDGEICCMHLMKGQIAISHKIRATGAEVFVKAARGVIESARYRISKNTLAGKAGGAGREDYGPRPQFDRFKQ